MHIAFLEQFAFFENITDMPCDDGLIPLKQLRHLPLVEPHGLVFESNFEPDGFVGLIDDDFVGVFWHGGSCVFGGNDGILHTLHRQTSNGQGILESLNSHIFA